MPLSIDSMDRQGNKEQFLIMSLSIGVVTSERNPLPTSEMWVRSLQSSRNEPRPSSAAIKSSLKVSDPIPRFSIKDALKTRADHSLFDVEQELTGLSHAEIGGYLAGAWHLPVTLREPILYHHNPTQSKDATLQTAIVHVADILVKGLACGNPGDDLIPPLSKPAWDQVGLDEQSLAECIDKASQEFVTIDDYL